MKYTFTHAMHFKSGNETLPYRSTRFWKTERGALKAAEQHAEAVGVYYNDILQHQICIYNDLGQFVTNMAA